MKKLSIAAAFAFLASLGARAFAQPTYMRESATASESEDSAPKKAHSHGGRKSGPAGADKQAIEGYLQGRLNKLQRMYGAQQAQGKRMSAAWDKYWSKLYDDRKRFEVRVARNRLDLFESLGSLNPAAHNSAIADYERLQTNLWRSFEDKQKEDMAQFFAKMLDDLKAFSSDQERARQDFMTEASDAWQAQKTAAP
jgi:hypothetical protein